MSNDFEESVFENKIKIPLVELIEIEALQVDGNNPNEMTEVQRKALKANMKEYGFLVPVITNEDLLIADGQQRWETAKDLGMEKIPVIRLPLEEVDRKILRQVLNKLKGEHDSILDDSEFKEIQDLGGLEDLESLLGDSDNHLNKFLKSEDFQLEKIEVPVHVEPEVTCPKCGEVFRPGEKKK